MANTITVWVRLKDPTNEADRLQSATPGALPLILRMRSADSGSDEDFIFPYSPREMNIGKLSDQMVQIERPGTTPIIAFKSHQLLSLDFTALIAHPGDGLIQSIDREISVLRKMGSSSDKVFQLLNYDIFTNKPFIFRNMSEERQSALFFSITEMSIDVTRRNKENSITSANVKISLVENRNPKINIALIPPLSTVVPVQKCKNPDYAKKHPEICDPQKTEPIRSPSYSQKADNRMARGNDEHRNKKPKIIYLPKGSNASNFKNFKISKPGDADYPLD